MHVQQGLVRRAAHRSVSSGSCPNEAGMLPEMRLERSNLGKRSKPKCKSVRSVNHVSRSGSGKAAEGGVGSGRARVVKRTHMLRILVREPNELGMGPLSAFRCRSLHRSNPPCV